MNRLIVVCLVFIWCFAGICVGGNMDSGGGKSGCKRALQKLVNEDVADARLLYELPNNGKYYSYFYLVKTNIVLIS